VVPFVTRPLAAPLLALPHPSSAIFAASDTQAIGVLPAANRLGMPVPGQLSAIGFDDIEAAVLHGLSTGRQPLELSGAEGAPRLFILLGGKSVRPMRQELPLEVVRRSTSAPMPPAGRGIRRPSASYVGAAAVTRARTPRQSGRAHRDGFLHDHTTTASRMTRR
jgi:Periplasmic binding protein-like domain